MAASSSSERRGGMDCWSEIAIAIGAMIAIAIGAVIAIAISAIGGPIYVNPTRSTAHIGRFTSTERCSHNPGEVPRSSAAVSFGRPPPSSRPGVPDRDHSPDPMYESLADDDTDTLVVARYQLLARIGHGGMGEVFEAWDPQLERRVALKILLADSDDELALREARFLARVAHPNVVAVHEVGRCACRQLAPDRGTVVYIAMEYVDGPDLRRWLASGPRRWTDVLDAVLAAGQGLAAVHRAGLIHGDVKPQNVLVGSDGRVRVADFGLARVRSRAIQPELAASVRLAVAAELEAFIDDGRESGLDGVDHEARAVRATDESEPRPAAGTLPYMAPECLSGERAPRPQADQYSLCAMAWETLFGVRPFAGRSAPTLLTAIALGQLQRGQRPRGLPRAVVRVLRRGLSERPEARWPSVEALLAALERARRPLRWVAHASAAAAGGVVVLVALASMRSAEVPEQEGSAIVPAPSFDLRRERDAVASAERALVLARASERSLDEVEASLGQALADLDSEGLGAPAVRVELLLARARVHEIAGRVDAVFRDIDAALELVATSPHAISDELATRARLVGALAALERGQCARATASMALIRGSRLDAEAARALSRAMHGRGPAQQDNTSDACTRVWQDVEALAAEFTTASRRRSR